MNASLLCRLGLLALLALIPVPSWAQEEGRGNGNEIVLDGYGFPVSIMALARGSSVTYPIPGYGFSVRYASGRDTWADVYVYDKQRNLTPPPKDALKAEMYLVLEEIFAMQRRGSYESTKLEAVSVQKNLASARLSVTADGKAYMSFAFLTISKGKFVKIRFSTHDSKVGPQQADAFRQAMFGLIEKTKPVVQPKRDPRFI